MNENTLSANALIKTKAVSLLNDKWHQCAFISLIYFLLTNSFPLVSFIISGPLCLGIAIIFLKLSREEDYSIGNLFKGFDNFFTSLIAYILVFVFIVLWALLLIIPGMVAAFSYSLTFFIIADNPDISAHEAILKSKELMRGHKGELFSLFISFFGWIILSIVTFGVAFLWVFPYLNVSFALFYKKLKDLETK